MQHISSSKHPPNLPMLSVPHVPHDPLWKLTDTTLYISGGAEGVWSAMSSYILEQNGWHVINVRPQKASIKVECPNTAWSLGFVVKIKLFATVDGFIIEWQRRHGCAFAYIEAWHRFRSSFGRL